MFFHSVIISVPTLCFPVILSRASGTWAASHLQPHWPVRHLDLVRACGCPHCCHTHCADCSFPCKSDSSTCIWQIYSNNYISYWNTDLLFVLLVLVMIRYGEPSSKCCFPTRRSTGPATSPSLWFCWLSLICWSSLPPTSWASLGLSVRQTNHKTCSFWLLTMTENQNYCPPSYWLLFLLSFAGATSAPCLIFIFPAIFYIRIVPKEEEPLRSAPKIMVRRHTSQKVSGSKISFI